MGSLVEFLRVLLLEIEYQVDNTVLRRLVGSLPE